MTDLYPEPSWNFVFGQAMLTGRVGVFSFARYDPAFYGEKRGTDWKKTLLRRSLKVLAHETAHMFGLGHCVYFECIVSGSNHLGETDARPMHLCPVCLRKLQKSAGFDVSAQHRALQKFYKENGFAAEAAFMSRRIKRIEGE
jgi:archaemetzincin